MRIVLLSLSRATRIVVRCALLRGAPHTLRGFHPTGDITYEVCRSALSEMSLRHQAPSQRICLTAV